MNKKQLFLWFVVLLGFSVVFCVVFFFPGGSLCLKRTGKESFTKIFSQLWYCWCQACKNRESALQKSRVCIKKKKWCSEIHLCGTLFFFFFEPLCLLYGTFLSFFCEWESYFSKLKTKKKEETYELPQKFAWLPEMFLWRMFETLQASQFNCRCWQHGNYLWELWSKLRSIKTNEKPNYWKKSKETFLRVSEAWASVMPFVLQSSHEILKHKFWRISLMSLRLNKNTYTHLITRYKIESDNDK